MIMVRLIMFTGKGGVGKTTTSNAVAIWFATHGFKTLLLSADPAHSIGDSLNVKIGTDPTPVPDVPALHAMEIDSKKEYAKLKAYIKRTSKGNIDKFLTEAGLPGMTELAALYRVYTYVFDIRYDIIVVDTPPSGHTLDMLDLPQRLDELAEAVKKIIDNLNTFKKLFSLDASRKTTDRIDSMQDCVKRLKWLFGNTNITSFNLVSTAEYMSLREEMRTYVKLEEHGIRVNNIVLNKLQPVPENGAGGAGSNYNCPFCTTRYNNQAYYVNVIDNEFKPKGINIIKILASAKEIVGTDLLARVGDDIIGQLETGLDVKQAYMTEPKHNGDPGAVVRTQLPYVEPKFLKVFVEDTKVIFTINYGLHEDVINVLNFKRPIRQAIPFNDNNHLSFNII